MRRFLGSLGLSRTGSYWTSEHLRTEAERIVEPFDANQVVNCAVELSMGPEGYVTGGESAAKTFLALDGEGSQLVIPPGQFALLLTEETVKIPASAIGFISIRARFKVHGLVNVSGFHVDPGFRGRLVFSVYNAGGNNVVVSRGERLFLLWVASLEAETDDPYSPERGTHWDQQEISNRDIMVLGRIAFSPTALHERLIQLDARLDGTERRLETAKNLFIGIVVGVAVLFLGWIAARYVGSIERMDAPSPSPVESELSPSVDPTPTTTIQSSPKP